MEINMVEKVVATEAALELIELLKNKHGPVFFHQSGGCCDNSAANCYPVSYTHLDVYKRQGKYRDSHGIYRVWQYG